MKKLFALAALVFAAGHIECAKPKPWTDYYKKDPADCVAGLQIMQDAECIKKADSEFARQTIKLDQKSNVFNDMYKKKHILPAFIPGLGSVLLVTTGALFFNAFIHRPYNNPEDLALFSGTIAALGFGSLLLAVRSATHVKKLIWYPWYVEERNKANTMLHNHLKKNPNYAAAMNPTPGANAAAAEE